MSSIADHDTVLDKSIHLTPREREVLLLLCEALPNKLIARRLDISLSTVKIHISNIFAELGVSSRLQAVVAVRRGGLVPNTPVEAVISSRGSRHRLHDGTAAFASSPVSV